MNSRRSADRNKFVWLYWVASRGRRRSRSARETVGGGDFSPVGKGAEGHEGWRAVKREKRRGLFRDAIINRYDRLNRNGIRPIACAGSIISRTDLQGARGSFNARIGVSIIAISFIRLFFCRPLCWPADRAQPSTIADCPRTVLLQLLRTLSELPRAHRSFEILRSSL